MPKKPSKKSKDDDFEDEVFDEPEDIEENVDSELDDEDDIDSDDEDLESDDEGLSDDEGPEEDEILDCDINDTNDYTNDTILLNEKDEDILKKDQRVSANRLTKYEMVRILGERTKQLTMGAKPLIKNHEGLPYNKIAEEELKHNMIPFKIKRSLPNGKYELWNIDELKKEHLLHLL